VRLIGESIQDAINFMQDRLKVTRPEAERFLFHKIKTKKIFETELGFVEDPDEEDTYENQYKRHKSLYQKSLIYHKPRLFFHKDRLNSDARSRYPRKKMGFSDVAEDMMNSTHALDRGDLVNMAQQYQNDRKGDASDQTFYSYTEDEAIQGTPEY
jgi:hypothetical protein